MEKKSDRDEIEYIDEADAAAGNTKILKLKKELEVCKTEKDEYLKGWQRAKADYANAERSFRERESSSVRSREEKILCDMLEILDGFDHSRAAGPPNSPWAKGILQPADTVSAILARYGVEVIETSNQSFDPTFHEAVEVVEVDDLESDHKILGEYQKGYMREGRVLRPSKVKVGQYSEK